MHLRAHCIEKGMIAQGEAPTQRTGTVRILRMPRSSAPHAW